MSGGSPAARFSGAVPALYDRLLVPMIFAEPAAATAAAVVAARPSRVLETACGTGVLTELLAGRGVDLVATDLNPAMLEQARRRAPGAAVRCLAADMLQLPFPGSSFDVVVCQFGVMFLPDRVAGYREAARVLRTGGTAVVTVWGPIEANPVADVVTRALEATASTGTFDFLRRTPHGHGDARRLEHDVRASELVDVAVRTRQGTCRTTAADAATAYCQGTPLRGQIEAAGLDLEQATTVAREALLARFGPGQLAAATQWLEVTARRPG